MTTEIEQKFMLSLLKDAAKITRAISSIPIDAIQTDQGRWLYNSICTHFMRHGVAPTKTVIDTWLDNELNDSKKNEYLAYLKSVVSKTVIDTDFNFYMESIINTKAYKDTLDIISATAENINPNNVNDTLENLENAIYKIRPNSNQKKAEYHNLSTNIGSRIKSFHTESTEEMGIPTPIKSLTEAIGGFKRAQLSVIAAPSGHGKSIFLLNFANHAYEQGKNVVFVTIEMSYVDCVNRWHSLITGIDSKRINGKTLNNDEKKAFYYKLINHQLDKTSKSDLKELFRGSLSDIGIVPTDEEKKLYGNTASTKCIDRLITKVSMFNFNKHNFTIFDSPYGVTVPQLHTNLKNISNKFPIDLVAIDYLNIMNSGIKGLKDWEEGKYISRALKQLAREFNVPILTACQLNDNESKEMTRLSQSDVRYSRAINENADNVIAFNRTEQDEMLNIVRLELIKHRHSERKVIPIRADFAKMTMEEISDSQ